MLCEHNYRPSLVKDYEKCILCGTYRSIAPVAPELLYNESYRTGTVRSSMYEQVWNVDMHTEKGVSKNRFVLDRIEVERGSALDIGCAPGRLLFWLQHAARFKNVVGIDGPGMSEGIRKVGVFDGELLEGLFPEVTQSRDPGTFDYIAALDVFEHSWEPMEFLKECFRLLRPKGQLFLMMPFADKLPTNSAFFNAAEHVYLHSLVNMNRMVREVGFTGVHFDSWKLGHETMSGRKP